MADNPYSSADFQEAVRRGVLGAAIAAMGDARLDWERMKPFVEAARALAAADLAAGGVELHATHLAEGERVDSEEAWIVLSAREQESGNEWLARTYWLSDLATAGGDPERVRAAVAGLERSVARLKEWLAERDPRPPEE